MVWKLLTSVRSFGICQWVIVFIFPIFPGSVLRQLAEAVGSKCIWRNFELLLYREAMGEARHIPALGIENFELLPYTEGVGQIPSSFSIERPNRHNYMHWDLEKFRALVLYRSWNLGKFRALLWRGRGTWKNSEFLLYTKFIFETPGEARWHETRTLFFICKKCDLREPWKREIRE